MVLAWWVEAARDDAPSELVADVFERLDGALEDLSEVRYSALSPGQVRAAVAGLYQRATRVQAQAVRALAVVDERDDVVPAARAGKAGVTFAQHGLGMTPGKAAREATTAKLLREDVGDLSAVGAAFAAGTVGRDKVEVCVNTHAALGAIVREEIDTLAGVTGRRIDLVDAVLAAKAVEVSTPVLARFAADLVAELNPRTPAGAHERRFLHLSQDADGSWLGRFGCGPAQGALIKAVISAWSKPRPGVAVDRDGVRRDVRDERDLGQRQMDAFADLAAVAAARTGTPVPDSASVRPDPEPWPDTDTWADPDADSSPETDLETEPSTEPAVSDEPPAGEEPAAEGMDVVVRAAGVLAAPYPPVEIVVTVGLEHLAAALTLGQPPGQPRGSGTADRAWIDRLFDAAPTGEPESGGRPPGVGTGHGTRREPAAEGVLAAALRRAPGLAHAQHAPDRPVDATTLRLFACSGLPRLRLTPDP